MTELKKSKPTGAKGVFIKKISMSSTMGKSMIVNNSTWTKFPWGKSLANAKQNRPR